MAAGSADARAGAGLTGDSHTPPILDVAIIGGGVSGIYSGWRLSNATPQELRGLLPAEEQARPLRVELFEMSDRIGGRLLSLTPPEIPVFKAELGGMRYLTTQPLITDLVERLQIATHPFAMGGPENVYYLRGHHLRRADFADPAKVPYRLRFQEQGKTPGQIITDAIEMIVPGATRLTPAQWQEVKAHYHFNGAPLYAQGFWNVLYQVVSNEAFELLLDAGGYNSPLCNWNAAEALPWYLGDFGQHAQYRGFDQGFEQVPLVLAREFEAAGGTIRFEHTLVEFDRIQSGSHAGQIRLRFATAKDDTGAEVYA
ncbi:MAG: FAD-dependent oxidoreductase, partial [Litorilinea sp.]